MTCDEFELQHLTEAEPTEASRAHAAGCEKCRAFVASSSALLEAAALPGPSAEEKAKLTTLAPRVLREWSQLERRRSFARRVLGLAVAACVGAAVASAALLPRLSTEPPVVVTEALGPVWTVAFPEPELSSSLDTDDELDTFEVSWPSP